MTKQEKQTSINDLIADSETLLALEPEELAAFVLKDLIAAENTVGSLIRHNYCLRFQDCGF